MNYKILLGLIVVLIIILSLVFIFANKTKITTFNDNTQIVREKDTEYNIQHWLNYLFENNINEATLTKEQSIETYNKYLEHYPQNLHVLKKRALTYSLMKEYDKSIEDYTTLINFESQNIEYINDLIRCYIYKNDLNQAKDKIDKYYANIEKGAEYYYLNGELQTRLNKYDSALKFFDKAIELDDKNEMYYISRARVYQELHRPEDAIKDRQIAEELIKKRMSQEK